MSRVRSAAKVAVSENTACYENLANAIILQAVKDYKWALHRLDVDPRNQDAMHEKERLERVFHSPWYKTLTDLDADRLIEGGCRSGCVRKQPSDERRKPPWRHPAKNQSDRSERRTNNG